MRLLFLLLSLILAFSWAEDADSSRWHERVKTREDLASLSRRRRFSHTDSMPYSEHRERIREHMLRRKYGHSAEALQRMKLDSLSESKLSAMERAGIDDRHIPRKLRRYLEHKRSRMNKM